AHWWRASGRYEGAAQWLNEQRENGRSFEPALQALEIRVAGELHNAGVLARALEHLSHLPAPNQAASTMMLCAFVGEQELTSRLLDRALPELPADAAAFWRVTSAQRAGAEAPEAFSVAASSDHPLTRSAILRRRETPLGPLTPDERDAVTPLLRRIEIALSHGAYAPPRAITPWVTRGIVAVLLAMFALEIPGGVEDLENLVRLGAVIFPAPDPFNWRLVSAGLLHFGWLHLILNSVAILFFGARLERYLGRTWTFTVFVCSNIGAMALAVATLSYSPDTRTVLIGASGGVMGIVGAVFAHSVVTFFKSRSPQHRRELGLLSIIVIFQMVFDAATPQVSGPVHLYGLAIGCALTLARSVRKSSTARG
ncbi:MAG: rhomboid family intramembrane serine protease, partial [Myxococcota bacterium]